MAQKRSRASKPKTKHAARRVLRKHAPVHVIHATRHADLSWKAPDFHLHPRGVLWGFSVVGIGATAAILFALYGNYTLAAIVFLASLVLVLGSADRPEMLTHTVTPKGLVINNWLLSWNYVKSFWIISVPEGNKLHLDTVKRGLPVVTVYLGDKDPDTVRQTLSRYLPEHPTRGEQLTDILARLLKV